MLHDALAQSDSPRRHPLIVDFVTRVDNRFPDGIPDFAVLETRPFMLDWRHWIIMRYVPAADDLLTVFFGTHAVEGFGEDPSGKMLADAIREPYQARIRERELACIRTRERAYYQGDLSWKHRDFTEWRQVKMPLRRGGEINEALTFVVYE